MPYSNYTKIHDLLTELDQDEPKDLFEFAQEIHDSEIESFAIWRPDSAGSLPVKSYCSPASIRRLIRFVSDLELVRLEGRQCSLTNRGRSALRNDQYASTLATHLALYLKQNAGTSYTQIKDTIIAIRRPDVAFFETIYERIAAQSELQISKARFRMVMYLLERCSMLTSQVKKIYFAPEIEV